MQNHLRTAVKDLGQIEIDEVYVGIDRFGAHHIIPVQAKGGTDKINLIQIEQDIALCRQNFPRLICRPVAAKFTPDGKVALFDLAVVGDEAKVVAERHFQLVPHHSLTPEELELYRQLSIAQPA
jgi:hypothetical protein